MEQSSLRKFVSEPTMSLMDVSTGASTGVGDLGGYRENNPMSVAAMPVYETGERTEKDKIAAIQELERRGAAGAPVPSEQSVMAAPRSRNPFNPAFRETLRSALNDFMGASNIASAEPRSYARSKLADFMTGGADFVPVVGDALATGDLKQSIAQRDPIGIGINTLGVLPIVGKPAAKAVKKIKAYHASPYEFEKFSLDYPNTGEGAQAYGEGLYFAENPRVNNFYLDTFESRRIRDSDHVDEARINAAEDLFKNNYSYDEAKAAMDSAYPDYAAVNPLGAVAGNEIALDRFYRQRTPNFYTVDINADRDLFIDLDKPLKEQSPQVLDRLQKAGIYNKALARDDALRFTMLQNEKSELARDRLPNGQMRQEKRWHELSKEQEEMFDPLNNATGKDLLSTLERKYGAKSAATFLNDSGIPGTKFKDAFSRGYFGGTQNFVVFDESLIDTTRRDQAVKIVGDEPLAGAPGNPNIPGIGRVRIGPNPEIEQAAIKATTLAGVPYRPVARYTQIDPNIANMAAREYGIMKHSPDDPIVASAYEKMIEEMMPQYDAMLEAGIKPYFIRPDLGDPYSNSPYEALIDIYQNKRLGVFPTFDQSLNNQVANFGSDSSFDASGNPLLRDSGRLLGGLPATYNDIFRAVHDYYGHGKSGVGFRAMGEENAYQSHAGMFSPEARRAVASETRGQNSFLNFGPHGAANRSASVDDTIFADQKTGLMPRYASEAGLIINDPKRERFFDALRKNESGLEGAITDDGKLLLTHRAHTELERIDPEKYGSGLSGRTRAEINRARGNPDFVKRSYYGIPASENPYRPESGIGAIKHDIEVEPELMYDAKLDPDNLRNPDEDFTQYEQRIANAGYTGFFADHPQLGKFAAVFDPYDVKKVYSVPLIAAGVSRQLSEENESEM